MAQQSRVSARTMAEARQSQELRERKQARRGPQIQAHGEVEERLPLGQEASVRV
jgi:hypothetical protein